LFTSHQPLDGIFLFFLEHFLVVLQSLTKIFCHIISKDVQCKTILIFLSCYANMLNETNQKSTHRNLRARTQELEQKTSNISDIEGLQQKHDSTRSEQCSD